MISSLTELDSPAALSLSSFKVLSPDKLSKASGPTSEELWKSTSTTSKRKLSSTSNTSSPFTPFPQDSDPFVSSPGEQPSQSPFSPITQGSICNTLLPLRRPRQGIFRGEGLGIVYPRQDQQEGASSPAPHQNAPRQQYPPRKASLLNQLAKLTTRTSDKTGLKPIEEYHSEESETRNKQAVSSQTSKAPAAASTPVSQVPFGQGRKEPIGTRPVEADFESFYREKFAFAKQATPSDNAGKIQEKAKNDGETDTDSVHGHQQHSNIVRDCDQAQPREHRASGRPSAKYDEFGNLYEPEQFVALHGQLQKLYNSKKYLPEVGVSEPGTPETSPNRLKLIVESPFSPQPLKIVKSASSTPVRFKFRVEDHTFSPESPYSPPPLNIQKTPKIVRDSGYDSAGNLVSTCNPVTSRRVAVSRYEIEHFVVKVVAA